MFFLRFWENWKWNKKGLRLQPQPSFFAFPILFVFGSFWEPPAYRSPGTTGRIDSESGISGTPKSTSFENGRNQAWGCCRSPLLYHFQCFSKNVEKQILFPPRPPPRPDPPRLMRGTKCRSPPGFLDSWIPGFPDSRDPGIPGFLDSGIPGFPGSRDPRIPGSPDPWIPGFPGFLDPGIPGFLDPGIPGVLPFQV